jgi:hypothetical protein
MEDWLLIQGFYHGLTQRSCEQLDATVEGSFMSLTVSRAKTLMNKIAENQSWIQDNVQHSHQIALSTKMDVLLDWLDQRATFKKDRQAIQYAYQEYLGNEFSDDPKNTNTINNSSTQRKQGWNQQK